MAKLIILQGPPASGKTTWARSFALSDKGTVIVSRDDIRHGLGGDYWQPGREGIINQMEDAIMRLAFGNKLDIINDGLNLSPDRIKHLKALAEEADAIVEFKEFYCDFWTAVDRDSKPDRPHHIGEGEIRKFYQRYYPEKLAAELAEHPTPPVIINPDRLMTLPDGRTMRIPNSDDLLRIKKLAALRYTSSQIARMLGLPPDGFRMLMEDKNGEVYSAYDAGILESTLLIRERTRNYAEKGEEWAVKQVEKWEIEQRAEEYGCHN